MSSWQSPSSKLKQKAALQRRARERVKPRLHLHKVRAEIKVTGHARDPQFAEAQVVLNDFSPLGVALFSSAPLMVGDEVALTLEHPKQFYIRGRIISCQEIDATSKVLSQSVWHYRIGVQFTFETEEEKSEVRAYCDFIARDVLFGKTPIAA
jgi:hypothetical protein